MSHPLYPLLLSAWILILSGCQPAPERTPDQGAPTPIRSGLSFLSQTTQALQQDEFANPGFLWVDQGAALFEQAGQNGPACLACHSDRLKGAARHFPKRHPKTHRLFNLETQINYCRTRRQDQTEYAYESAELLSLTAYLTSQSRGQAVSAAIADNSQHWLEQGRRYFHTRRGQFNLSCAQCHSQSWGRKLRGETISQGHGNGFPAYRFSWQGLGSLHRRFRDCDQGIRAAPLDYGDDTYIALELYLRSRASGLEIESPAIRR